MVLEPNGGVGAFGRLVYGFCLWKEGGVVGGKAAEGIRTPGDPFFRLRVIGN